MDLSIIIVNYKSESVIFNCIESVKRHTTGITYEIIVVDNDPGIGISEKLKTSYPDVLWLSLGYNAGFSRANNAGIRISKGKIVLLLNSDTLVDSNAIGEVFRMLSESNQYVAAGVQLLFADGTPQISGNFAFFGGLNYLMLIPYVGELFKLAGNAMRIRKPNLKMATHEINDVDWVNGAFLMVKQSAIAKVGYLDEDFFLYSEEAEWCSRLRKAGKICIFGRYNIIHLEGQSSNVAFSSSTSGHGQLYDRKGLQLMLSMFVRIRKEFGLGWFIFHFLAHLTAIPFVFFLSLAECLIRVKKAKIVMFKSIGYMRNMSRCSGYFGRIIINKPFFYKVI